ncbi:MAG: hypothetical protein LAP87_22230 [Acidobacteriia bacterium]|nr:hypothetical protein [Terriglobia bacterium]
MRNGSESGHMGRDEVAHRFLMECARRGQTLWMGERLRSLSGEADEPAVQKQFYGLWKLQINLLRHYFQLQRAERNLSSRVQIRRRGTGRSAIRQIERERQRLGRELHTGVGQMLAAIRLQVEVIAMQLPDPPAPVAQSLARIATLAGDALEQVRSVSQRLHPPEWQRLTLAAALTQLWEISGIPQKFEACLRIEPLPREPGLEVKVLVYRAAQEALANLTRHSRATRIGMSLAARGDCLVLTVEDNGVGFDAVGLFRAPATVASGIGLRSMREQAAALGGRMEIQSGPNGTRLEVSTPFLFEDAAAGDAA